jgi:hypothetical protein
LRVGLPVVMTSIRVSSVVDPEDPVVEMLVEIASSSTEHMS